MLQHWTLNNNLFFHSKLSKGKHQFEPIPLFDKIRLILNGNWEQNRFLYEMVVRWDNVCCDSWHCFMWIWNRMQTLNEKARILLECGPWILKSEVVFQNWNEFHRPDIKQTISEDNINPMEKKTLPHRSHISICGAVRKHLQIFITNANK